jgi:hypothetical protein
MEFLIPIEALIYSNLDLNEAVESVECACEITGIAARIADRETRLALIRHRQAQNKLAQAIQRLNHNLLPPTEIRPALQSAPT